LPAGASRRHIKKNGRQEGRKRTLLNADEELAAVFGGRKQVSMFEMTKLAAKHVKR
jgi:chromatin remodeling complex protein RSC6